MRDIIFKLRQLKLEPIPTMLGICFVALLGLIVISGISGPQMLEDISNKSDESIRGYKKRLELATKIHEAAADTVRRARFYRASTACKIRGPVFGIALNKSEDELLKLIRDGRNI